VDLEQDYVVKTSKTGGSAMSAMMLTAATDGKAPEAGQAVEQAKGPGELLDEALKGLEGLPGPSGKPGKAWKQAHARIVALVRQAKEMVDGQGVAGAAWGAA